MTLVAINSTVILDEGDGKIAILHSDPQISAVDQQAVEPRALDIPSQAANDSRIQREAGDQVNRFLLCTLVSKSAKLITRSAANAGEPVPMTMIVRGVLRSYRLEAADRYGALAAAEPDLAGLRRLNEKVLRDETARHSRDRVKTNEKHLAHAKRLGDDTRIKTAKDDLVHAIELHDRLAKKFN
jgi:hypothetical protein